MRRGIIDAIWWKLHTAFLKNERRTADLMLGMIEDEGKRSSIKDELGPIHFSRFELIQTNIHNGSYGRLYGYGFDVPDLEPTFIKESTIEEADFHLKIISGRKILFDLMGIDKNSTMLHEIDLGPYGRCDFIIKEGRTHYVVEIKMGQAKHSVVSQIDKYRTATELDMCFGLHDKVNAIVIAESFSPYVASELSRLSVEMIKHDGTAEGLKRLTEVRNEVINWIDS